MINNEYNCFRIEGIRSEQEFFLTLKKEFSALGRQQQRFVLDNLSSRDRKMMVNIFKENMQVSPWNLEKMMDIEPLMCLAKSRSYNVTKKDTSNSPISRMKENSSNVLDSFRGLFGHVSSKKANHEIDELRTKMGELRQLEASARKGGQETRSIPKEELLLLIKYLKEEKNRDTQMADLLTRLGYSCEISGLSLQDVSFKNLKLWGLTFKDCRFYSSHFSGSDLEVADFIQCTFQNSAFMNSNLVGTTFSNCEVRESMFCGARLNVTRFLFTDIIGCSFEEAHITRSHFQKVSLQGTHFLKANIDHTSIEESDLKNAVLLDNHNSFEIDEQSRVTLRLNKPIVVMLCHPEARGITVPKMYHNLEGSAGLLPIRLSIFATGIDKKILTDEVEGELLTFSLNDYYEAPGESHNASIAAKLIEKISASEPNDFPQSRKILEKAKIIGSHVDAIVLPGGEDIPPLLYGEEEALQTDWGGDYLRSILELGLIKESQKRGIPIKAVCRGFQMLNVYFGAKLVQDVPGEKGLQKFSQKARANEGLYAEVFRPVRPLKSASFHHQAIFLDSAADPTNIESSVVSKRGIVKAVEHKRSGAAPLIGLQFHPEFMGARTAESMRREGVDFWVERAMSSENKKFWKILHQSAETYRQKRTSLLSDLTNHSV